MPTPGRHRKSEFTPLSAYGGGLLIGLSAALLLLANGRIAGISGILDGALRPQAGELGWRVAFLVALLAGLVFGIGLVVSQMVVPEKVLGFLDVFGDWNPSLAFVMGGAILVAAPAFALARRMDSPDLARSFEISTRRDLDVRLLSGAAIFGIGWGLVGLCPGPALVALDFRSEPALPFVAAMIAGMIAFHLTLAPSSPKRASTVAGADA